MRRAMLGFVVAAWAATGQAGVVSGFGDIRFWTGSGTGQSALVIDFGTAAPQGSPPAVAWGYRWSGPANLADMLFALTGSISGSNLPAPIPGADPRLGLVASYFASLESYFIRSIAYDQVGLPPGWSQETRAIANDFDNDRAIAQYEAPAAAGAWPAAGTFALSPLGPADTALADGGWYGYVVVDYDPATFEYPATTAFYQPTAAIPEPSAVALAAAGAAALVGGRRRRRRRRAARGVRGSGRAAAT